MIRKLSRNNRGWLALRGILAVLIGLATLWSGVAPTSLGWLFGAYALADGFLTLIISWPNHQVTDHGWLRLLKGLPGIALGGLACLLPSLTGQALRVLIIVWALLTGALEVLAVLELHSVVTREQRMDWNGMLRRQAAWDKPDERKVLRNAR